MASSPVTMRIGPSDDSSKAQFNEHRCNMLKYRLEHAGYRVIVEHADNLAVRSVVLHHRGRIVAKCNAVESVLPKEEVERLLRAVDAPQPRIRRTRLKRKAKAKPKPIADPAQDPEPNPKSQERASPPPPPPARQSSAIDDAEAISSVNALDLHRRLEELSVSHESGQAVEDSVAAAAQDSAPSTTLDAAAAPAAIDCAQRPTVPAGLGTTWAFVPFRSVSKGDLTELQSLKAPPQPVHDVLHVVCLLIGAARPKLKGSSIRSAKQSMSDFDWDMARRVLARKGEDSLPRCMMRFDPAGLNARTRRCAEQLLALEHMKASAVKCSSVAASSLLAWAMAACQAGSPDHAAPKTSKEKASTKPKMKAKVKRAPKAKLDPKSTKTAATAAVKAKIKMKPKVAAKAALTVKGATLPVAPAPTKPRRTVKAKAAAKTAGKAVGKSLTVAKSPQRQGRVTTLRTRAQEGSRVRRSHSGTGLMLSVSISRHDLVELKAMCKPPQSIKDVCEVVLLLLGEDLDSASDSWACARKVLCNMPEFQKRLSRFSGGAELSARVLRRVRNLMAQKHLTVEAMRGKSLAACSLLQWALDAMMTCPPATASSPDVGRGGLPATAACSVADASSSASVALKTKTKKKKKKMKTTTTTSTKKAKAHAKANLERQTGTAIVVETAAAAEAAIKPKRKVKRKSKSASKDASAVASAADAGAANGAAGGVLPLRADATRHILEGFIKARMPKSHVLELGNGLGGGAIVRQGKPFLDAYAEALRIPRGALVDALRMAPGDLEEWATQMEPREVREINE